MHTKDIQALAAVALFYIVIESLGVTCPILFLTGISCAGCGMSRAWLSLLRLDLAGAFAFHPLFWLTVAAAALTLASGGGLFLLLAALGTLAPQLPNFWNQKEILK